MSSSNEKSLLDRKVTEGTFTIISPVLDPDEESEWLIYDGNGVIPVTVADQDFLQAVKDGEVTFVSGCTIVCQLEVTQWLTTEGVRSNYELSHITEIISPPAL